MQKLIIVFLSLLLAVDGIAQQNCRDCGVAFFRYRIYNPELKTFIMPRYEKDIKYLFYDSMIIAERHGLYSHTDANKKETWRREVIGYTFIDFRTQSFYDYRNFSDTARIILSVRQPPEGRVHGGWTFFLPPRVPDKSIPLPDTVVDGNRYQRLKGIFQIGDTIHSETQFYVSEQERPVAYYGKTMANGKKVSLIRIHSQTLAWNPTYNTMDITSRNLSKKELKVFAVWKRNARKTPVAK